MPERSTVPLQFLRWLFEVRSSISTRNTQGWKNLQEIGKKEPASVEEREEGKKQYVELSRNRD